MRARSINSLGGSSSRRRARWLLAGVMAVSSVTIAAPALAADCSQAVDVQLDQDACATTVAVSLTGDATGSGCTGYVSCVSVSGTGDASNSGGWACGFWSVSIDSHILTVRPTTRTGCVAVSGTGNASNSAGQCAYAYFSFGLGLGCVAVSGTGNASNSAGTCAEASPPLFAVGLGCVAVSGMGNASNSAGRCAEAYRDHDFGLGCVAVSGTGNASNSGECYGYSFPLFQPFVVSCVAVSGTGNAANSAGTHPCYVTVGHDCVVMGEVRREASSPLAGEA